MAVGGRIVSFIVSCKGEMTKNERRRMLRPTRDTRGAHREWPMPNSASERPSCHGGAPKPSGQRLDFHDVEATAQLTEGTGTGRFGSAFRRPSKNPLGGHRGNSGVAVRERNIRCPSKAGYPYELPAAMSER